MNFPISPLPVGSGELLKTGNLTKTGNLQKFTAKNIKSYKNSTHLFSITFIESDLNSQGIELAEMIDCAVV